MAMSTTDRYTQSQTRLHKSVTTELNTATAQWRRNAANAHLAAFTYHSFRMLLATQLGCAERTGPAIRALYQWQSLASLAIYVRMQPRDAIEMLDVAQNATIAGYSTVK